MVSAVDIESATQTGTLSAIYASAKPGDVALIDSTQQRTFRELHENANRLAHVFRSAGLQPGDAVALVCSNRCEFVEVFLAAFRTGLRFTPVNWHLSHADAEYIVSDCEARAILIEERFVAATWSGPTPHLEVAICIGSSQAGLKSYADVLEQSDPRDLEGPVHGNLMLYTSGTTGRPKGVYVENPLIVAPQLEGTYCDYQATDAQLCCGPAYHASPLLFDIRWPLASGVPVILLDGWDSSTVLKIIEQNRVTHTHMVPIMFQRLLALPEQERASADISSLRRVLHGAAPCPPEVKRQMIEWMGPILTEYYGASEGGAGIHISTQEWLKRPGSVGCVPDPEAVRILDPDGKLLPAGVEGEIFQRMEAGNPFIYFKAPEKTASVSLDGYFTLGDIGHLDDDGYLYLTGRSAECIISGGVNIYPREIDDALSRHPAVEDICTVGAPDDEWGERVVSVVQLKPGLEPTGDISDGLARLAEETLSKYKRPRQFDFVASLPRLPNGKILRQKVRDQYWSDRKSNI